MKKLSFTLRTIVLSCSLINLHPVLAQVTLPSDIDGKKYFSSHANALPQPFLSELSSTNELPLVTSNLDDSKSKVLEIPEPQIEKLYSNAPPELDEITNVHQLQDVTPDHWAYEALRNLVEKYGCISDISDGKFNGNRAINRYEFAVNLNSCLMKIGRLIDGLNNKFSQKEDLVVIKRLQSEFATEIAAITSKIDNLEERIGFVQEHRFSPTSVLRGSVSFNLISAFGNKKAVSPGGSSKGKVDENLTLSGRTIVNIDTSFTGKDRLRTQLVAGNVNSFGSPVTGTNMTLLVGAVNTSNNVKLGTLFYQFPIGDRGTIAIAPVADFPTRIFPALNPVNSISNFGAESPIYSFAFGSGATAYYRFTDKIAGGITYLTTSADNPKEGLFHGQYTVLAQATYAPSDQLALALTYAHYYAYRPGSTIDVTGSKGSLFAQLPFGANTPTSSNAFGLQFTYKLTNQLILGGWSSYFHAQAEGSPKVSDLNGFRGSNANIWSWAITASFADLGKLGSQVSFVFGVPPKVMSNDIVGRKDKDTSLHIELSYSYPITDKISITPGFLVITNPEHNAANAPIWLGLIRTSFSF
jgi:hypothetical protein